MACAMQTFLAVTSSLLKFLNVNMSFILVLHFLSEPVSEMRCDRWEVGVCMKSCRCWDRKARVTSTQSLAHFPFVVIVAFIAAPAEWLQCATPLVLWTRQTTL